MCVCVVRNWYAISTSVWCCLPCLVGLQMYFWFWSRVQKYCKPSIMSTEGSWDITWQFSYIYDGRPRDHNIVFPSVTSVGAHVLKWFTSVFFLLASKIWWKYFPCRFIFAPLKTSVTKVFFVAEKLGDANSFANDWQRLENLKLKTVSLSFAKSWHFCMIREMDVISVYFKWKKVFTYILVINIINYTFVTNKTHQSKSQ